MSVTVLEHVDRDKDLIRKFGGFLKPRGTQLHIAPAAAALPIYLWHGYRQYTPRDLVERFGTDAEIVQLGGAGSLLVHLLWITIPELLLRIPARKLAPRAYAATVLGGFKLDRLLPIFPTALAVFKKT